MPRPRAGLVLTWVRVVVHGRYTVVRKLAEGGMAEIFLARQHGSEGFEKPVVLKRIHTAFYADEQFRNMLVDEAHISMGLHHNNIVQVLDLGRAGGRLFLVLELVDGWDLARVLDRAQTAERPLPPGIGLYIIAEVCRALSYAHSRTRPDGEPMGIVHRDISPQNVLISEQGEVKLADFGIAKALTRRDRTATGVVKGKVAFMSPEQAHGQALDARSDLFSLGTLLYLVTTGRAPVRGGDRLRGHRPRAKVPVPAARAGQPGDAGVAGRDHPARADPRPRAALPHRRRAAGRSGGGLARRVRGARADRAQAVAGRAGPRRWLGAHRTHRRVRPRPQRQRRPATWPRAPRWCWATRARTAGARCGWAMASGGDTEDTALAVVGLPEIGALEGLPARGGHPPRAPAPRHRVAARR